MRSITLVGVVVVSTACTGKQAQAPATGSASSVTAPNAAADGSARVSDDVRGYVNASVPSHRRALIAFEFREASIPSFTHELAISVAVPSRWELRRGYPNFWQSNDASFPASIAVGFGGCGGNCAAAADALAFGQWVEAASEVLVDRRSPGRRTVAAEYGTLLLVSAWWAAGAQRYYTCSTSVPVGARDLLPAFERACESARVVVEKPSDASRQAAKAGAAADALTD